MCINFNGSHSGGSTFVNVNDCWLLQKLFVYHRYKYSSKKIIIIIIRSPSIWFRTPKPVQIRQSGRTGIRGVTNMGGIDPTIITHRLNVSPSFKLVKQKRRSFAPERQKAINEEVDKLFQAGAIREVEYPEWLANVVLVKKVNDKWRLCIALQ